MDYRLLISFLIGIASMSVRALIKIEPSIRAQFLDKIPMIDGEIKLVLFHNDSPATQFTQTVPKPDQPSAYESQLYVGYTAQVLYIVAKLFQPDSLILRQMTARNALNRCNADVFSVFFRYIFRQT
jgi:hypothetical protein